LLSRAARPQSADRAHQPTAGPRGQRKLNGIVLYVLRIYIGRKAYMLFVAEKATYTQPGEKSGDAGAAENSPSATRF